LSFLNEASLVSLCLRQPVIFLTETAAKAVILSPRRDLLRNESPQCAGRRRLGVRLSRLSQSRLGVTLQPLALRHSDVMPTAARVGRVEPMEANHLPMQRFPHQ
jgi:hypothetical protein